MDVLNLWNEDPEELLLEMGFGCDEPDLSGRIPARFINYQSQAKGINLQVFLEAQQNRVDLENPDVSNRFRQVEVLQQVTTAFSSLVSSSSTCRPPHAKEPTAASQARRRRYGILLRRASKKFLSQSHHQNAPPPEPAAVAPPATPPPGPAAIAPPATPPPGPAAVAPPPTPPPGPAAVAPPATPPPGPAAVAPPATPPPGPAAVASPATPPPGPAAIAPPPTPNHSPESQQPAHRSCLLNGVKADTVAAEAAEESLTPSGSVVGAESETQRSLRKKTSLNRAKESFEMEEISFDETSVSGGAEHLVRSVMWTNSCQSDSSGFLEEPVVSPNDQLLSPRNNSAKPSVMGGFRKSGPVETEAPSSSLTSESSSIPPQTTDHPSPYNMDSHLPVNLPKNPVKKPIKGNEQQVPATGISSNPVSTLTGFPHVAGHKVHSLPPFDCCSVAESSASSPLPNQNDSLSSDGRTTYNSGSRNSHCEDERASFSFQSDKLSLSETSLIQLNSAKLEEGSTEPAVISQNRSVGQSVSSSQSADTDLLIYPAVGKVLNSKQPSHKNQQQEGSQSICRSNSLIQNGPYVEMDRSPLNSKDTPKKDTEQKTDEKTKEVDTEMTAVSISDTESSSSVKESSWTFPEEEYYPTGINQMAHFTVSFSQPKSLCQMAVDSTQHGSPESVLKVPNDGSNLTAAAKPKDLIEIDSLDLVFETSVDGSDSENGDMQAFLQQLEAEGKVYWAEPVQLSNSAPVPEEFGSFDTSDNQHTSRQKATCSNVDPISSNSATPNTKTSGRSVSLQMPSSLSSHIVHRKDVPYTNSSKQTSLPCILPLDTSTPFRAVQSWTDLQIQRTAFTKNVLHKDLVLMRASEKTQKAVMPSPKCFPPLSIDWQSHETLPDLTEEDDSLSVDTGLWPDEQDSFGGNETQDMTFWEHPELCEAACCCSSLHQQFFRTEKCHQMQHAFTNCHRCEDEEMMKSLQQFSCVLSDMEEQLCEDQAAVYGSLPLTDREMLRDVEDLRRAVKQEAAYLELLLNEVTCDHDAIMRMKMHSLLEEQALLYSQLKLRPTSRSPMPSRTVATQCCLLPPGPL